MNMYRKLIILFLLENLYPSYQLHDATRTDISQCKVTQSGVEYRGPIDTTSGGIRCKAWFGEHPQLNEVNRTLMDIDFSDGSIKEAKNYCRNPTRDSRGPWCYTIDPTLILDDCEVPLCNFGECRISGAGAEYGGSRKVSASGHECLSWDKHHKLSNGHTEKMHNKNFPDTSRSNAKKFCRNPNDDRGGPWCYTATEKEETVHKEYCDVPFCDDKDCLVFTRNSSTYSTITKMNSTLGNLTLWIKLWNPTDGLETSTSLLLSHLPIPTSSKKIAQDWSAGIEISISNRGTALIYPNEMTEIDVEPSPNILLGTKWTGLSLVWVGGLISLNVIGSSEPIFLEEYGKNNTISGLYPDGFLYYGFKSEGTGVLWSTDLCQQVCEVHTTFGDDYLRVWPVHKENGTIDITFYVRANRKVSIQLYQSPTTRYPCFTIKIDDSNKMRLMYQEDESSMEQLVEISSTNLLSYWVWQEYIITIVGPHLRMLMQKKSIRESILLAKNNLLALVRWFSIGSDSTIAHWTLFCAPKVVDQVQSPLPPDCVTNPGDAKYVGFHWVASNDKPCIPWSSEDVPAYERNNGKFIDGSALRALNLCRNVQYDNQGPYCYTLTNEQDHFVATKTYCNIRKCKFSECRMAGTGNDYMGTVSVTRSNRTCAPWLPRVRPKHKINPTYFNDTLYAERNISKAQNYCRDPSRSIAGPWCYTMDRKVSQDLCHVQDCDMPEECMFIVKGPGIGRRLFVLPEYRTEGLRIDLKVWEPDNPDSITLVFTADDNTRSHYILKVGAMDNEKMLLYYQAEEGGLNLVMQKTLPHLLFVGKWTNFRLRIPRGSIELYYDGSSTPIFEWTHNEPLTAFLPIYYYYSTELGRAIAIAFDCSSRCAVEVTQTDQLTKILPVSTRGQSSDVIKKLVLMIRGRGVVQIPLLLFPEATDYFCLNIGEDNAYIWFSKKFNSRLTVYHKSRGAANFIFDPMIWTNLTIRWFEQSFQVLRNGTPILNYKHIRPLLFYYFSVTVEEGGWAMWTANCEPPAIESEDPVDGGWSEWGPWTCSASCNGGVGTRKRLCNNPPPNVRGEPCMGSDVMTGKCNTIRCGDITEETFKLIRQRIKHNYTALKVSEGDTITIIPDIDVIALVNKESRNGMEMQWSHNGIFIHSKHKRVNVVNNSIVINRAEVNDSGVYSMTLHRVQETHMILKVVTLVVYPVETIMTLRETSSLDLACHCTILGYLYANLKIAWLINNRTWKNYGTTLPISVDLDTVISLNVSHSGRWECVISQDELNFHWITNALLINVIGPPNWKTHLMEDPFTRPIFGWISQEIFVVVFVVIILCLFTICLIAGTWCFLKFQRRLQGGMSTFLRKKPVPYTNIINESVQSDN